MENGSEAVEGRGWAKSWAGARAADRQVAALFPASSPTLSPTSEAAGTDAPWLSTSGPDEGTPPPPGHVDASDTRPPTSRSSQGDLSGLLPLEWKAWTLLLLAEPSLGGAIPLSLSSILAH